MLVIDFDQAVESVTFLERNPIFYQGRPLAGNAPGALRWTKQSLDRGVGRLNSEALAAERALHPGLGDEFFARIRRPNP